MNQEFLVLTTRGRLLIAAESQQHANALATSDGYTLDTRWAPFTEYETDRSRIFGSLEQEGRFIWATDTRCPQALKDMIRDKIVTFKCKTGILAEYIKGEKYEYIPPLRRLPAKCESTGPATSG